MHTPLPSPVWHLLIPLYFYHYSNTVSLWNPLKTPVLTCQRVQFMLFSHISCLISLPLLCKWPHQPFCNVNEEELLHQICEKKRKNIIRWRSKEKTGQHIQHSQGVLEDEYKGLQCICCYCTYVCACMHADIQTGQERFALPTVCSILAQHCEWTQADPSWMHVSYLPLCRQVSWCSTVNSFIKTSAL